MSKAPIVVLKIEFGASDKLHKVCSHLGVDWIPVQISILVYARFSKFVLNEALFVRYSNYILKGQPFVDLIII